MNKSENFYLRPSKERLNKFLLPLICMIILELLLFANVLKGLGFLNGKKDFWETNLFGLIILIAGIIFIIIVALEFLFRYEVLISKREIVIPGRGFGLFFGIEKRKHILLCDIRAIYLDSDSVIIESEKNNKITVKIYPDDFIKILKKNIPELESKIH